MAATHPHEPEHEHAYEPTPAPAPTPAPRRGYGWASLGGRVLLTLLGTAGLVVSAFLDWTQDTTGVNLDIRALWDEGAFGTTTGSFIETIGFAAIMAGLVAVLGMAPRSGWLTRFAGAVAIAGFILFAIQLYRTDGSVGDIGVGAWLALVAGVVALVGGFLGTRTAVYEPDHATVVHEA